MTTIDIITRADLVGRVVIDTTTLYAKRFEFVR